MARHARTARAPVFSWVALRLRGWARRTERAWALRFPDRRNGAQLGTRVVRETSMLVGVFAAALAAFGLLFVLAGHPLRVRTPQPAAAAHGGGPAPSSPAPAQPVHATLATAPVGPVASAAASTTALAVTPPAVPTAPLAASQSNNGIAASPQTNPTAGHIAQQGASIEVNPPVPPPSLEPPVSGAVIQGFGWAYSAVFGDWQQHTGIDLAVQPGQRIVAPGAGVVAAVRQDSLWGSVVSIVLDHGYSTNLSPFARVDVKVGQPVQVGTPLGTAAGSSPAEATLPAHVFWQLFAGTRSIDPSVG